MGQKGEGTRRERSALRQAKIPPVEGFLVPRAGGGTAPVPPDESHLLRQKQKTSLAGVFCYSKEEEVRFEGNVPVRGKRHPVNNIK